MSRAIVLGLISNKTRPDSILVSDPDQTKLNDLKRFGIKISTDNADAIKHGEVVILAVKPDIYEVVLPQCKDQNKLFISIAAGISVGFIKSFLSDNARVIRVMPNTPALVGAGMTVICKDGASDEDIKSASYIFESVGEILILSEKYIDAVTGVSGSGPAYIFTMIEAMADGGVLKGLTRDDAIKLAAQTVLGSAKLLIETKTHPAQLRDMVCSPGGTTIEGVRTLEDGGFRASVINAVSACTDKSAKLKK